MLLTLMFHYPVSDKGYASDGQPRKDAARAVQTVSKTREHLPKNTLSELLAENAESFLKSESYSAQSKKYAQELVLLDKDGSERLRYFFGFLNHTDVAIAANAHLEFALASEDEFKKLCRDLNSTSVKGLIEGEERSYRLKLYLAMLAECGSKQDGAWVQRMTRGTNGGDALAAMLATSLALLGEEGLEFIRQEYLSGNERDRLSETYSALMALRFARKIPSISKEARVSCVRLFLDRPLLEDLAISALGFHEDWDSIERVVEICKSPKIEWSQRAAIGYLRLCPLEEATVALAEVGQRFPKVLAKSKMFYSDEWILEQRKKGNSVSGTLSIRPRGRGGSKWGC